MTGRRLREGVREVFLEQRVRVKRSEWVCEASCGRERMSWERREGSWSRPEEERETKPTMGGEGSPEGEGRQVGQQKQGEMQAGDCARLHWPEGDNCPVVCRRSSTQ